MREVCRRFLEIISRYASVQSMDINLLDKLCSEGVTYKLYITGVPHEGKFYFGLYNAVLSEVESPRPEYGFFPYKGYFFIVKPEDVLSIMKLETSSFPGIVYTTNGWPHNIELSGEDYNKYWCVVPIEGPNE